MSQETTYHVYHVKDRGEDKKPAWIKLGAGFANKDGKGFNIVLDALPLNFDGQLTMREVDRDDAPAG